MMVSLSAKHFQYPNAFYMVMLFFNFLTTLSVALKSQNTFIKMVFVLLKNCHNIVTAEELRCLHSGGKRKVKTSKECVLHCIESVVPILLEHTMWCEASEKIVGTSLRMQ